MLRRAHAEMFCTLGPNHLDRSHGSTPDGTTCASQGCQNRDCTRLHGLWIKAPATEIWSRKRPKISGGILVDAARRGRTSPAWFWIGCVRGQALASRRATLLDRRSGASLMASSRSERISWDSS